MSSNYDFISYSFRAASGRRGAISVFWRIYRLLLAPSSEPVYLNRTKFEPHIAPPRVYMRDNFHGSSSTWSGGRNSTRKLSRKFRNLSATGKTACRFGLPGPGLPPPWCHFLRCRFFFILLSCVTIINVEPDSNPRESHV